MKTVQKICWLFLLSICGSWIISHEASATVSKSVKSESELKAALTTSMGSETELQITVTQSFTISGRVDIAKGSAISVVIRSSTGNNYTLTKASSLTSSPMFYITGKNDIEFRNIDLKGHANAIAPMIMDGNTGHIIKINNSDIYGNQAPLNTSVTSGGSSSYYVGGGISVQGTLQITGTSAIYNCRAAHAGGGVRLFGSNSKLEISGTASIRNNVSFCTRDSIEGGRGGNVHIESGTMVMSGSSTVHDGTSMTYKSGTTIVGNGCGGNIYSTGGTVTLSDNAKVYNGQAFHGGGIYLTSKSALTFSTSTSGSLYSNQCNQEGVDGEGSAMFVNTGSTVNLISGNITGNGGSGGKSSIYIQNSVCNLKGLSVYNNSARECYGFKIRATDSTYTTSFTMTSGSIKSPASATAAVETAPSAGLTLANGGAIPTANLNGGELVGCTNASTPSGIPLIRIGENCRMTASSGAILYHYNAKDVAQIQNYGTSTIAYNINVGTANYPYSTWQNSNSVYNGTSGTITINSTNIKGTIINHGSMTIPKCIVESNKNVNVNNVDMRCPLYNGSNGTITMSNSLIGNTVDDRGVTNHGKIVSTQSGYLGKVSGFLSSTGRFEGTSCTFTAEDTALQSSGTLLLSSCTVKANNTYGILNEASGTVSFYGNGTIQSPHNSLLNKGTSDIYGSATLTSKNNHGIYNSGTLKVRDSATVTGNPSGSTYYSIRNDGTYTQSGGLLTTGLINQKNATMTSGEIKRSSGTNTITMTQTADSTFTMTGGTVSNSTGSNYGIEQSIGTVSISGNAIVDQIKKSGSVSSLILGGNCEIGLIKLVNNPSQNVIEIESKLTNVKCIKIEPPSYARDVVVVKTDYANSFPDTENYVKSKFVLKDSIYSYGLPYYLTAIKGTNSINYNKIAKDRIFQIRWYRDVDTTYKRDNVSTRRISN